MKIISNAENESGYKIIFCRFIRKNGKVIYPKSGKFFKFKVEI